LLNFIAIASYPKHQAPKDLKVSKSDLLAIYKDWDPTIQKLIDLIEEPECFPLFDWLPIKTWVFEGGRVVLMGDAAHVYTSL
jgi:2-polyprenyl-6-methoxyphenol hydroxylase-like FAD-dependent oxidoreductase